MERGRFVRRGLALLAAAGLTGSLLAATASADEARPDRPQSGEVRATEGGARIELDWGACPKDVPTGSVTLECAAVPVPLDYGKPEGTKIKIMISRLASQDPAKRRGILMLNPGGPGGAGLSQPADLDTLGVPTTVLDSYDLIGMDPRGVGHSTPVSCGFTTDQPYQANLPPYPVDSAAVAAQAKIAESVAEQCAANDTAGLLPHISTANTARDLDWIRAALGETKINYFGASYGSVLGAAYASLFPDRTDRLVIDSNAGDTALDHEGLRRFGLGAEQRFPDFAKYLAERHGTYGLGRTPAEVRRNYLSLAERLDRKPIAGVDGTLFRFGIFVGLYGDASFPKQAQLWQSLAGSDESAVRRQVEDGQVLTGPGRPVLAADPKAKAGEPSQYDNAFSAFLAVNCNDAEWPEDVATYQRDVATDRKRYPLFGAAAANITPCAYWADPAEPQVKITDDGPANVLIVQNLRDPATPHLGGVLLRQAFDDRARLVSIDQGGHGAYIYNDNPCGLKVTTAYLVEGKRPAHDVFCPASKASGLKLDSAAQQLRADVLDRLPR